MRPLSYTRAGSVDEAIAVVSADPASAFLAGGTADDNEPPEAACARELKEEIGLALHVGQLLVVDWQPARAERPRPTVSFVFDAGVLDDAGRIRLQEDELDDHGFFEPRKATSLLGPGAARLPAARAPRRRGTVLPLLTVSLIAIMGFVALAIDLPDLNETGLIGRTYDQAEARPRVGFFVETLGATLALLGAIGTLVLRER